MHFALPPRKTSRPPPYHGARSSHATAFTPRRTRLHVYAWPLAAVAAVLFLISFLRRSSSSEYTPPGSPPVVIITTIDPRFGPSYETKIKANRLDYASRHGYATFFPNVTDYDLSSPPSPSSWSKVPAVRHALTLFPHSTWFFFLDQHALIMRPDLSLSDHVVSRTRLERLMVLDLPVVPPDSVIHTLNTRSADHVELILTQDLEGLSHNCFIVKRGEWAKYFLDSWFDPLYRSYNFQKAEGHALEHLVQWHGTVLTRLAIVPQRTMNSYTRSSNEVERYQDGDFVAHFIGCNVEDAGRSCEDEAAPLYDHVTSNFPQGG